MVDEKHQKADWEKLFFQRKRAGWVEIAGYAEWNGTPLRKPEIERLAQKPP